MRILIAFLVLLGLVGSAQAADVCSNWAGVQAFVPAGVTRSPAGVCSCRAGQVFDGTRCSMPDLCSNWAGGQQYLPAGALQNGIGTCSCQGGKAFDGTACVVPDLCSNWSGVQATLPPGAWQKSNGICSCPAGQVFDGAGCSIPDHCTNWAGTQAQVPAGASRSAAGICSCPIGQSFDGVACAAPDQCKNIAGVQAWIPPGAKRDAVGNCSCVNAGDVLWQGQACVPRDNDYCTNWPGTQLFLPSGATRQQDGSCTCAAGQIFDGRTCVAARGASLAELAQNWGINAVKAQAAWAQGWTGRGVLVGVIDTGIARHPDLPNVVGGKGFVGAGSTADDNGHGTHVAGIIGATLNGQGTVGVAPDATLVPYKVLDPSGSGNTTTIQRAVDQAVVDGVRVANLSIALPSLGVLNLSRPGEMQAMWSGIFGDSFQRATAAGVSFVLAAGNSSAPCTAIANHPAGAGTAWAGDTLAACETPAALPLVQGFGNLTNSPGAWIVVGAVQKLDPKDPLWSYYQQQVGVRADGITLASFSNRAGLMADFFLVAPGEKIVSTGINGGTVTLSGTSMAAPFVTGAFALLAQKYPFLAGRGIAQILFVTADDLGAPGTDPIYGRGLVNLEKAMAPIGSLRLQGPGRTAVASAVPAILTPALAQSVALKRTMLVDTFGRGYAVDASRLAVAVPIQFSWDAFRIVERGAFRLGLAPAADDGAPQVAIGLDLGGGVSVLASRQDGVFGVRSAGLFEAQAGSAGTWQTRLAFDHRPWRVWVDMGFGPDSTGSGLVTSVTGLVAAGAGIAGSMPLSERDTLSVSLASPLALVAGQARLHVPTSQAADGGLAWTDETLPLRPTRRQLDLRLGLDHPIGRAGSLALGLTASAQAAAGVAPVRADIRLQLTW